MLLDMNQGNWNILESNCGSISLHMPQPHLWVKASHVHVFGGTITVNFRYTSLHDFVKIAQTTLAHSYLYRWHWTTFALWLLWNIDPVNWTFHVDGTWTWLNVFWYVLLISILATWQFASVFFGRYLFFPTGHMEADLPNQVVGKFDGCIYLKGYPRGVTVDWASVSTRLHSDWSRVRLTYHMGRSWQDL